VTEALVPETEVGASHFGIELMYRRIYAFSILAE